MVYGEYKEYNNGNRHIYQILKRADEETRKKIEKRLKDENEKEYYEYKEFEKRWDKIKPMKLEL